MERGLYSAATGMSTAVQWLDVVTQNLANVSTTAYKRDAVGFDEGLQRLMNADGGQGPEVGFLGAGPTARPRHVIFEQGAVVATGSRTDFAIARPEGMFAVQTQGGIAYTRNGAFSQDTQGYLVTQAGDKVLDRQLNPIQLTGAEFTLSRSGEITQASAVVAELGVFDGAFAKLGENLFEAESPRLMDASELDVRQHAVEQSNVNAITEMVAMIKLNRAFEMAQKSASSQDETSGRLIQALQQN